MTSSRHGLLLAAVLATVLLAFLGGRDRLELQATAQIVNWLLVPALWAAAVLAGAGARELRLAVPATLGLAAALAGWTETGVLASFAAAGLIGALALRRGWRQPLVWRRSRRRSRRPTR